MSQNSTKVVASPRAVPAHRLGKWHVVAAVVLVILASAAGITAMVWWEERPLAEAEAMLEQGQLRAAQTHVNRFLRNHPQHGRALALKARVLSATGDADAAIDLYGRVGAADPKDLRALSKSLLQKQRWGAALPILKYLSTTGIDHADVLHELAACHTKLGNTSEALAAAEQFASSEGNAARGNLLIGTIHRDRGNLRQAAAVWSDVLKLRPDATDLQITPEDFFLEFGRVLVGIGDSKLAIDLLQRSSAILERGETLQALGDAYTQLGDMAAAETSYRRVLELEPGNRAARVGLAQAALANRKPAEALDWLAPFEASEPRSSEVTFLLQRTYAQLGNRETAEKWRKVTDELRGRERIQNAAEQVMQDFPDSNWAQVIRAYRFAEDGNWDEAERILKPLQVLAKDQPFIQELITAVQSRGTLPPLSGLPVKSF